MSMADVLAIAGVAFAAGLTTAGIIARLIRRRR